MIVGILSSNNISSVRDQHEQFPPQDVLVCHVFGTRPLSHGIGGKIKKSGRRFK